MSEVLLEYLLLKVFKGKCSHWRPLFFLRRVRFFFTPLKIERLWCVDQGGQLCKQYSDY
jgi:hypothetical protein